MTLGVECEMIPGCSWKRVLVNWTHETVQPKGFKYTLSMCT